MHGNHTTVPVRLIYSSFKLPVTKAQIERFDLFTRQLLGENPVQNPFTNYKIMYVGVFFVRQKESLNMSYINETVNVNAFYFATSFGQLKTFPRQVELGSKSLTFKDGLQNVVQKGQNVVRLFDMNDGDHTYRLRLENDTWTLVGTR